MPPARRSLFAMSGGCNGRCLLGDGAVFGSAVDTADEAEEHLSDDELAWLAKVEEEVRLIEAMPIVVGRVGYHYDNSKANLNKVFVTVGCCWASGRLKREFDTCTDDPGKPTFLEALQSLRMKLQEKHMRAEHPHNPRAVAHCSQLHDDRGEANAATAFDRIKLAQARQRALVHRAQADEAEAARARAQEAEATRSRERAEAQARESKAAAENAQPPKKAHKKQRTAFSAAEVTEANADDVDDPDAWEEYSLQMFRSLTRKYIHTSNHRIDKDMASGKALPRGDDHGRRGWRHHKFHGLYGALQHWANGSPDKVAFMLAELAKHFNVDRAVAARLGFALGTEQVMSIPPALAADLGRIS